MSRWAETFAALSGGADTVDTLRHYDEPASTLSHSVQSGTPPPELSASPSVAERAFAVWGKAEDERAAIVEYDGGITRDRPFARIDQAGLLWLLNGDKLVALSENTAMIETRIGARRTYRRKPSGEHRVLAWELIGDGPRMSRHQKTRRLIETTLASTSCDEHAACAGARPRSETKFYRFFSE